MEIIEDNIDKVTSNNLMIEEKSIEHLSNNQNTNEKENRPNEAEEIVIPGIEEWNKLSLEEPQEKITNDSLEEVNDQEHNPIEEVKSQEKITDVHSDILVGVINKNLVADKKEQLPPEDEFVEVIETQIVNEE